MRRQHLNPKELFDPRIFSHVVTVDGPMTLVQVSGQVALDRDGAVVGKGDLRAQAEHVFQSLSHALRAAGAGWRDVIKMNAYMVGLAPAPLAAYREVRSRYIDAKHPPASTLVGVAALVHPDLLLEVELVAAVSGKAVVRPAAPPRRR